MLEITMLTFIISFALATIVCSSILHIAFKLLEPYRIESYFKTLEFDPKKHEIH